MLPKLALDGVATRESAEQLIHCLQQGDKDSQCVVYGYGVMQPIEITPPLLSAWGGTLLGFSLNRWVHALSANARKLMGVMENITKLVRANKFTLDTVLYKVGEDAITDAFSRSADASDSSQVVLIFPTLQEELKNSGGGDDYGRETKQMASPRPQEPASAKSKEDEETERLKAEWLNLLFTDQSVAAQSPEGPLPVTFEGGNMSSPQTLVVWIGDDSENALIQSFAGTLGSSASLLNLSWLQHAAGEGLAELSLSAPQVVDGSWYLRDRSSFENEDLDQLHDFELLGRSLVDSVSTQLAKLGLSWRNVVLAGFGRGAGVATYALLARLVPEQIAGGIFFNPIIPFPGFLAEKAPGRHKTPVKMFMIWGARDRSTPGAYRQLLQQTMRKFPEVTLTPDTMPDNDHCFNDQSIHVLSSLLPMVMPR